MSTKIAIIAPSPVPFTIGGAEKLWWGLLSALNQHANIEAELIKVPSAESTFSKLISSYESFSRLDLSHFDIVLSTKYPAWMIDHPNHFVYLQHRLRGLYDTYPSQLGEELLPNILGHPKLSGLLTLLSKSPERGLLPHLFEEIRVLQSCLGEQFNELFTFPGPLTRVIIHWLDAIGLHQNHIRSYAAISETVAKRKNYFPPNHNISVIYHPSDLREFEAVGASQIFTVSRLDSPKRLDLLIRSYSKVKSELPLIIAGSGPEQTKLSELAQKDPRVHLIGRITDEQVIENYSRSLFIPFIPYDEDLGLITIEAMKAGRAVLTAKDSGGSNEFVIDHVTGLSVCPDEESLAQAIQELVDNPQDTLRMGELAKQKYGYLNWNHTCSQLLALFGLDPLETLSDPTSSQNCLKSVSTSLPSVLVVSPFKVFPPQSGGQNRIYFLYAQLSKIANVTILSLNMEGEEVEQIDISPQFREISVPLSEQLHFRLRAVHAQLQIDCADMVLVDSILEDYEYMGLLKSFANKSDLVVASHPYLFKAISSVYRGAIIYDAHNVEAQMKKSIIDFSFKKIDEDQARELSESLLKTTVETEKSLIRQCSGLIACSRDDLSEFVKLSDENLGSGVVCPNGVDTTLVEFLSLSEKKIWRKRLGLNPDRDVLFFSGSWHAPNIEALEFLVELSSSFPDNLILVMGSVSLHPKFDQVPSNLIKIGLVSEVEKQTLLKVASIFLNPMSSGSGTNLKMLEYAASGGNIISTSFGNRGIGFLPESEFFCAELDEFKSTIQRAINTDATVRESMIKRARERVEHSFDWSVCAKPLLDTVQSIVRSGTKPKSFKTP